MALNIEYRRTDNISEDGKTPWEIKAIIHNLDFVPAGHSGGVNYVKLTLSTEKNGSSIKFYAIEHSIADSSIDVHPEETHLIKGYNKQPNGVPISYVESIKLEEN